MTAVRAPARGPHSRRARLARMTLRRLAVALPLLAVVTLLVFWLASLSPLDPVAAWLGERYTRLPPAQRAQMEQTLGLDAPWWQAWGAWVADLLHGRLGWSRTYAMLVAQVLSERLPWTLLLSGLAMALASVVGVAAGLAAGLRPGSPVDRAAGALAALLQAVPPYVLALAGVTVLAVQLRWLPTGGIGPAGGPASWAAVARHLVLPVIVLALSQAPWLLLAVRSSVHEALGSDAVRGARLRGLSGREVVRGHVLPVSLGPVVAVLGSRLPEVVVGAVVVEEVFAWPGLAAAVVASAQRLDFPLLAALTVATTALVLLGSWLADACLLLLDPRVSVDA